jgi:hypothetical protein
LKNSHIMIKDPLNTRKTSPSKLVAWTGQN